MAKQATIPKKKIGIMQEAVLQQDGEGSWSLKDNAKEALTTLSKHSEKIIVYATVSSEEDVRKILDKNSVPYDEVKKLEGDAEFVITGKNSQSVNNWETWTMSSIGEQLTRQDPKPEDTQKKFNKGIGAWLHDQVTCSC